MKIKARINQIIPKEKLESFMLPYNIRQLKMNVINLESLDYPTKGFFKRFVYRFKNRKNEWYWYYVCEKLPDKKIGDVIEIELNPLYHFGYFYAEKTVGDFTLTPSPLRSSGNLINVTQLRSEPPLCRGSTLRPNSPSENFG